MIQNVLNTLLGYTNKQKPNMVQVILRQLVIHLAQNWLNELAKIVIIFILSILQFYQLNYSINEKIRLTLGEKEIGLVRYLHFNTQINTSIPKYSINPVKEHNSKILDRLDKQIIFR